MEIRNVGLTYGALALLGTLIFVVGLWLSDWELSGWLSNQAVYMAFVFSGFVVRIIAGFGIVATYVVVCEAVLDHLSRTLKGRKVTTRRLVILLLILPSTLLVYSMLRVISLGAYDSPTIFDVVYLLAGIWGLILTVYLIPISRGEFGSFTGSLREHKVVEDRLTKARRKIKKVYHERITQKYSEAYRIEFARVVERLYGYRQRIAAFLFLPFALGSLVLPPIALLFMFIWVEAFLFRYDVGNTLLERSVLTITILTAGIYASIQIFAFLGSMQLSLSMAYLIGTAAGYVSFLYTARQIL